MSSSPFRSNSADVNPTLTSENHSHTQSSMTNQSSHYISESQNEFFDATFDLIGGDVKRLCLDLTNYSGHFSTILSEDDSFIYPIFEGKPGSCFVRNMSSQTICVDAETHSDPRNWDVYSRHLAHISQLFDTGSIQTHH